MDEGLEMVRALWDGETLDGDGRHFSTKRAKLHTRAERRPPIYVSAFGPQAARVAGRWGDGLWTLADPETVPEIDRRLPGRRRGRGPRARRDPPPDRASRGPGTTTPRSRARASGRAPQPDEFYKENRHDPAARCTRRASEQLSDDDLREAFIISSDPEVHVERVREIEQLGASIVVLMNNSGADPEGAIRIYGEHVLPALRRVRVGA